MADGLSSKRRRSDGVAISHAIGDNDLVWPSSEPMMVEARMPGLIVGAIALLTSGCVRFGYDERPIGELRPDQAPTIVDASSLDGAVTPDGPASDVALRLDSDPAADGAAPTPDAPRPDVLQPDAPAPDVLQPDAPLPDILQPDVLQPDSGTIPGIWVSLSKGTFTMGHPADEPCAGSTFDTQQLVTLSHDFDILATEVTQASFLEVMGYNPSHFSATGAGVDCGPTCPVETVNWSEAAAYCNALSARRGLALCYQCAGVDENVICQEATAYDAHAIYTCPGYRLPTSAEWEYAYRAETTTPFYSGDISQGKCTSCTSPDRNAGDIGWYCANSGDVMHPAQQRSPNAWGIYDMAGNVWELCHDWYAGSGPGPPVTDPLNATSGTRRVTRGGCYISLSSTLAAYVESGRDPATRARTHGFRCVRTTSF